MEPASFRFLVKHFRLTPNRDYRITTKETQIRGISYLTIEIVMKGKVFSGNRRGKRFVNLPGVKKQIKEKLGFNPYIGTLNLRLPNEAGVNELREANGIKIIPEKGYYEGKCFKALVMGKVEGAVVLPGVPEYPPDLLEVLAPVNLRETLGLKDGVEIELTITIE